MSRRTKLSLGKEVGDGRPVFITDEDDGRRFLDAPMSRAYVGYLKMRELEVAV